MYVFLLVLFIPFFVKGADKTVIKSKELQKDKNNIIAIGDVEINRDGLYMRAEKVNYDTNTKIIGSDGSVRIQHKNKKKSEIIFSKTASAKEDFSEAELGESIVVLQNGTVMRAEKINMEQNIYKMKKATYSMCPTDIFKDELEYDDVKDKKVKPLEISGKDIIFNRDDGEIKAKNTVVWHYGVPIFYSPYVSFNVSEKPKTGFGRVNATYSSNYKFGLSIAYNIVEKDYTLVLTPLYYQKNNYLLNTKFSNKYINLNVDMVNDNGKSKKLYGNTKDTTEENDPNFKYRKYRGLINGNGNYEWKNWSFRYNLNMVSDKFYKRDYYGELELYEKSNIKFEYADLKNYEDHTYFRYNNVFYQEFESSLKNQTPSYIPVFDYNIENKNFKLTANSTTYVVGKEVSYNRISLTPEARYIFNTMLGKISLNTTFNVNRYKNETNYSPQINIEWSKNIIFNDIILRPIIKYSQSNKKKNEISNNEDSIPHALSFNNIFSNNKLVGYDRTEYGKRFTYGFETIIFDKLSFGLAQGYSSNLAEYLNKNKLELVGFNSKNNSNKLSDYIGFLSLNINKNINVHYRVIIDKNTNDVVRNELLVNGGYGFFSGNLTYTKTYRTNNIIDEQITYNINLKLNNEFLLVGNTTQELSKKKVNEINKKWNQIISYELALKYNNNCFEWLISFKESSPLNHNVKKEKSFSLKFSLLI